MKNLLTYCFILLTSYLLLLSSCHQNSNKNNLTKNNEQQITINRYEVELFKLNPENLNEELKTIQKQYRIFVGDNINDPNNIKQLHDYLTDPAIKQIYEDCIKKYPLLDDLEKQFSDAFSNYKRLFPDARIPKVYTYVSGIDYNSSVNYADSALVVPIDMYLGTNYLTYSKIGIPGYITMRLNKEFIVRDCIRKIGESKIPDNYIPKTLLDFMIIKGKILYFTKSLMPDLTDNINMTYTKEQNDWCKSNEANLWSFLINNKLLFTNDENAINKFINDSPFTSVISKESPGRIGEWFGWQIVNSYMENNKNISLLKLMEETDSQFVLTNSKYKPRK
jgi:hypothetical protein